MGLNNLLNLLNVFQIIAVCDFLNYLKYVERGLVKSSGTYIYFIYSIRKAKALNYSCRRNRNNSLQYNNLQMIHNSHIRGRLPILYSKSFNTSVVYSMSLHRVYERQTIIFINFSIHTAFNLKSLKNVIKLKLVNFCISVSFLTINSFVLYILCLKL